MPTTYPSSNGESETVTGEDYAEQQREAGANVVSVSRPPSNARAYFSREKVWGPEDANGLKRAIYVVGDQIPEEEAIRQGIIEAKPEVETEVPAEVQTEKPAAPKTTQRKSTKRAATKKAPQPSSD